MNKDLKLAEIKYHLISLLRRGEKIMKNQEEIEEEIKALYSDISIFIDEIEEMEKKNEEN